MPKHFRDKEIGQRIRFYRKAANLTQAEIAQKLGITFQQLQKYESGANRISAARLEQLSRLLSIPVHHFYDIDNKVDLSDKKALKLIRLYHSIRSKELQNLLLTCAKAYAQISEETHPQFI